MTSLLNTRASRVVVACAAALFLILGLALTLTPRWGAAASQTVQVTTTEDYALNGDPGIDCTITKCSFRAALEKNDCLGGGNTVSLPAGDYKIATGPPAQRPFVIATSVTVIGSSARTAQLDGNTQSQVLVIDPSAIGTCGNTGTTTGTISYQPASVTLQHLAVVNGSNTCSSDCGGPAGITATSGGAPVSLTLDHVAVLGNVGKTVGGLDLNNDSTTLRDVTIANNQGAVGAISVGGSGTVSLVNTTISGNTGGVAMKVGGGTTRVNWSTIANNAGGILNSSGSADAVRLATSVLAANGTNCQGAITSRGDNVADDSSCSLTSTGDVSGTNPQLGLLANNGGEVNTVALLTGSPAVDKFYPPCPENPEIVSATLTHDARDQARPQGPACDSGSFELVAPDTTPPVTTFSAAPGSVPPGWPLISASASGSITAGTTVIPVSATCFDSHGLVANLNATDNLSGVQRIEWSLSPASALSGGQTGAGSVAGNSASVPVNTPGLTRMTYHATDNAGNQEAAKAQLITVTGGALACASAPAGATAIPAHGTLNLSGTLSQGAFSLPFGLTIPY